MITFLLLPYFLVSRVFVDINPSVWYYGPEYTYRVNVNHMGHGSEDGTMDSKRIFYVSNILKCRPRIPDTLNCRFDAVQMAAFEMDLVNLAEDIANDWATDDEPFEIKFNRDGVTELIVTDTMKPWTVNTIRAIANQFHIGMDLKRKPDEFIVKETSYLGTCNTNVEITRRAAIRQDGKENDMFYVVSINGLFRDPEEVVEIVKKKDLNSCKQKANYYFAAKDAYHVSLVNSTSVIKISGSDFTSRTFNKIVIDDPQKSEKITLHEEITLTLETIAPTTTDIPTIPRPSIRSFVVSHDDSVFEG